MIQESEREMNAEERAWVQSAMPSQSATPRPSVVQSITREAWGAAAVYAGTMVVAAVIGGMNIGGFVLAGLLGLGLAGYHLVRAARENAIRHRNFEAFAARRTTALTRVLEDGRVTVRRVRAVAVVEIEPFEDEGNGYLFGLEDGRVLFIKGSDYFPMDEEAFWPNTEFEIVHAAADGRVLDVYCHGTELPPLRIVRRGEVDPEVGWDEREEVLEMSLDEAVRTVVRTPLPSP